MHAHCLQVYTKFVTAAVYKKCMLLVLQTEKLLWLMTVGSSVQGAKNKGVLSDNSLLSRYLWVAFIFTSVQYLEKGSIKMPWL